MFFTYPDSRHRIRVRINALDVVFLKYYSNMPEGRDVLASAELIMDNQQARLFSERDEFLVEMCGESLNIHEKDSLVVEFGVFEGESLKIISSMFEPYGSTCYGFDTFQGLTEEWRIGERTMPKGSYSTEGHIPSGMPSNCRYIIGDASKTIHSFLGNHEQPISFAHFDMDIYTPTANVLRAISNRLVPGSIICFDQHHGYAGWKKGEFKALSEELAEFNYEYIAFSEMAAAIKII